MSSFNHYRTLEVDKKATTSQIRKAYRRLAMDHHPDKGGDTRQFQKIQDAYDVLSDPGKRAQYDGVGDGQTLASQPQIQHQKFPLTLEDMYKGGSKEIKLEYLVSCLGCGGQGGEGTVCSTCKGTKMMQKGIQLGPGMYQMVRQQCTTCHGKGREITSPCTTCHGKGQISKVSTQSVSFPRGVLPNEQIDIDVTGETIMLHVSTKPNPDFSRKNFDLHLKTRIHWVQALTGKDIFIDHISGERLHVNVTQPLTETVYIISDQGMPIDESYRPRLRGFPKTKHFGDLYLHIQIEWPTTLNPQDKQLLLNHFPYPRPTYVSPVREVSLAVVAKEEDHAPQCQTQ